MNCITIYTDASVCKESKIGGWSCWIKFGEGHTMKFAGGFKKEIVNSTDAELCAIANAITLMKNRINVAPGTVIVVVTDSAIAIQAIQKGFVETAAAKNKREKRRKKMGCKHPARTPEWNALGKMIRDMIPHGCDLRVKKVKAHSDNDGKRSYVNNLCDEAAKAAMRQKRLEKRKEMTAEIRGKKEVAACPKTMTS